MEDQRIVDALWRREEAALGQLQQQYGSYCRSIAYGVLRDPDAGEECLNDTLLQAWNSIPPLRPRSLRAWLGAVCRNAALTRWRRMHAEKRGASQVPLALEELQESLPAGAGFPEQLELQELLNTFLRGQTQTGRYLFLRRYWYMDSLREIAEQVGMTEGAVRAQLHRMRQRLRNMLEQEGIRVE